MCKSKLWPSFFKEVLLLLLSTPRITFKQQQYRTIFPVNHYCQFQPELSQTVILGFTVFCTLIHFPKGLRIHLHPEGFDGCTLTFYTNCLNGLSI